MNSVFHRSTSLRSSEYSDVKVAQDFIAIYQEIINRGKLKLFELVEDSEESDKYKMQIELKLAAFFKELMRNKDKLDTSIFKKKENYIKKNGQQDMVL